MNSLIVNLILTYTYFTLKDQHRAMNTITLCSSRLFVFIMKLFGPWLKFNLKMKRLMFVNLYREWIPTRFFYGDGKLIIKPPDNAGGFLLLRLFINRDRNVISGNRNLCEILCIYYRSDGFIVDCDVVKRCRKGCFDRITLAFIRNSRGSKCFPF